MNNIVIFALYLPSLDKKFVLDEIADYFCKYCPNAKIYVGIQGNSIPEAEDLLDGMKDRLSIKYKRVIPSMVINSDASAFLAGLEAYKNDGCPENDLCYFVHSKGITSNNDPLRKEMYDLLFSDLGVKAFDDPQVGSYGPYITFTDVLIDIKKLQCMGIFNANLKYKPMHYYYINTFFIVRGSIVKSFMETVSEKLFTTPIHLYSDRWLFERDFSHIADMMGYLPSYQMYHGNYSTNYKTPTRDDFDKKLSLFKKVNGL